MNTRTTAVTLLSSLTLLLTLAFRPSAVVGAEPEPVWREFILLGIDGDSFEDFPDFEAEGSRILVTHPPVGDPFANQSTPVYFAALPTGNRPYVEEFFGTTWYYFGEVTHVTADGPKTYRLMWKDELPPTGAVAQLGPDGDVAQAYYWRRAAEGFDGGGVRVGSDWIAEYEPLGANSTPFLHGAGWFSR